MKKIISFVAAFCLFMSLTAFAATTTDSVLTMTADKTTANPGDTITYTVSITEDSDGKGLEAANLAFYFDSSLITFDTSSIVYTPSYATQKFEVKTHNTKGTYLQMQNASSKMNGGTYDVGAFDVFKFTGTVNAGATGTIEFTQKTCNFKITNYDKTNEAATIKTIVFPTVTINDSTPTPPVKPVITLNAANAGDGIVKGEEVSYNETTGELKYKVTVETMPIGATAAYVVVNGDTDNKIAISGGVYEATYTADTTLTVAYDYDTASVFTYVVPDISAIYGTEPGIVAFGKGTIADGDEYGIIFGGEFDKAGKWTTLYNVNGIFAVEIADATTGNYTAKAFVNDAYGAELSITKE